MSGVQDEFKTSDLSKPDFRISRTALAVVLPTKTGASALRLMEVKPEFLALTDHKARIHDIESDNHTWINQKRLSNFPG